MCFVLDPGMVIVEIMLIPCPDHETSESESVRHQLHNLWGPVQNGHGDPLLKLSIWRWWWLSLKPNAGPLWARSCPAEVDIRTDLGCTHVCTDSEVEGNAWLKAAPNVVLWRFRKEGVSSVMLFGDVAIGGVLKVSRESESGIGGLWDKARRLRSLVWDCDRRGD